MSGRLESVEDRSLVAKAHLALLGIKISGNGILGHIKVFLQIKINTKINI